jgi:signal peptide peptidase SppA
MSNDTQTDNANHLAATCGDIWAIESGRMRAMLNTRIVGNKLSREEIDAATNPTTFRQERGVAVLPLYGPIMYRSSMWTAYFGGTSVEKWGRAFDELVASERVGAIVIDVDSPGGTVDGVPELAEHVRGVRGVKPIIAVSNTFMASAAYWIASAADEIVVAPSGEAGSIGVWSMHVDVSGLLEKFGEKVTLISAGKYKVEGNPYEPLTEEARAAIQQDVDHYYDLFVDAVAKGRGATTKAVRDGYGQGRMLTSKAAVEAGLANRVGTLAEVVTNQSRLLGKRAAELRRAELERLCGE